MDVAGLMVCHMESVVTGAPDRVEAGIGSETLDKLEDGDVDDLSGLYSAAVSGGGDFTWAFEWMDREVAPLQALMLSRDTVVTNEPIPEPAGLGLIGLALLGRRKRRK